MYWILVANKGSKRCICVKNKRSAGNLKTPLPRGLNPSHPYTYDLFWREPFAR